MDSRTSPKGVIEKIAREYGVKTIQRDVFLDGHEKGQRSLPYIYQQFDQLADVALENGIAVGIGHIHSNMIKALEIYGERFKEQDFELIPVSRLMH